MYRVVQIWPGQTVTCLHTDRPGHIWTTLYSSVKCENIGGFSQLLVITKNLKAVHRKLESSSSSSSSSSSRSSSSSSAWLQ